MIKLTRARRKGDLSTIKEAIKRLAEGGSELLESESEKIKSIEVNVMRIIEENRLKQEEKQRKIEEQLEHITLEMEYKSSIAYGIHKAEDTIKEMNSKNLLKCCNACKTPKKPNLFGRDKSTKDGLNINCKKCKNQLESKRERKPIDPQKQKENHKRAKENLEIKYKEFFDKSEGFLMGMGYKKAIGVRTKNLYVNVNADFKKITPKSSRNNWTIKDIKPRISYHKYYEISQIPVHRIMAYTFLGHTPNGHKVVVDHINNNKLDNSLKNLQLLTNFENLMKGRVQTGGNDHFKKFIKHIKY